jgi:hypothetical protein
MPMKSKFRLAMMAYCALAAAAALTLDGYFRIGVVVFLAGLAVRTWVHQKREDMERAETRSDPPPNT